VGGSLNAKNQLDSSSRFDTIRACDRQTDGQTERQTRDDSICRADMASSGKQEKISVLVLFLVSLLLLYCAVNMRRTQKYAHTFMCQLCVSVVIVCMHLTRCDVVSFFFFCFFSVSCFGPIRYDTIRDAILASAQKPTRVSLIYRTEPTTKKWTTEKLKS